MRRIVLDYNVLNSDVDVNNCIALSSNPHT